MYEAANADLTFRDLEEFVGFGEFLPSYQPRSGGNYYLPEQSLKLTRVKVGYDRFTPDQLQKSLFVDPAVSRNLLEKNGTEIFTDGKRGLQIYHGQHWMSYSDPVAPVDSPADVTEQLYSAVRFINRHGGWHGTYLLTDVLPGTTQTMIFRHYFSPAPNQKSLPVLSTPALTFGHIQIGLQRGNITNYERSLIHFNSELLESREAVIAGGDHLINLINQYDRRFMIRSVFPAYAPNVTEDYVELVPKWAVQLENGDYEFLY